MWKGRYQISNINYLFIYLFDKIFECVVNSDLVNISPSNIFLTLLFPERFSPNCQASILAAVCMKGLNQ